MLPYGAWWYQELNIRSICVKLGQSKDLGEDQSVQWIRHIDKIMLSSCTRLDLTPLQLLDLFPLIFLLLQQPMHWELKIKV